MRCLECPGSLGTENSGIVLRRPALEEGHYVIQMPLGHPQPNLLLWRSGSPCPRSLVWSVNLLPLLVNPGLLKLPGSKCADARRPDRWGRRPWTVRVMGGTICAS